MPKARAQALKIMLEEGRISVDENGIFHDKLDSFKISAHLNWISGEDSLRDEFPDAFSERDLGQKYGSLTANVDFGHNSPNTKALFELGFGGLLERVRNERDKKADLTEKQKDFYDACETALLAVIAYVKRYAKAVAAIDADAALCLENISENPPRDTYEALTLLVIYFAVHDQIAGSRIRTLGRMDVLLYKYYKNDLESGKFTKAQIRELYCYFLTKLWVIYLDLPV